MYRKILLLILAIILLIGCSTSKKPIPSYQYFIVDSVHNGGVYSFVIEDPNPRIEFVFPTGLSDYPQDFVHYVKLYYKNDTAQWAKNDTLILVKKP